MYAGICGFVIICIFFCYLLERKVLGYIHIRKGPDKVGFVGGGKGGRCVGLTTLPPSCAECLEI